jgi:hypothetical protein
VSIQRDKCKAESILETSTPTPTRQLISIPLPVCANDIRRYKEGSNAIINVIPTPTIRKHELTDTAYVLLHEVLSLYLPYGLLVAGKTQSEINRKIDATERTGVTSGYWETPQAVELNNKLPDCSVRDHVTEAKKLIITLWSDGCDPNARNKTNRGSMHILLRQVYCVTRNETTKTILLFCR